MECLILCISPDVLNPRLSGVQIRENLGNLFIGDNAGVFQTVLEDLEALRHSRRADGFRGAEAAVLSRYERSSAGPCLLCLVNDLGFCPLEQVFHGHHFFADALQPRLDDGHADRREAIQVVERRPRTEGIEPKLGVPHGADRDAFAVLVIADFQQLVADDDAVTRTESGRYPDRVVQSGFEVQRRTGVCVSGLQQLLDHNVAVAVGGVFHVVGDLAKVCPESLVAMFVNAGVFGTDVLAHAAQFGSGHAVHLIQSASDLQLAECVGLGTLLGVRTFLLAEPLVELLTEPGAGCAGQPPVGGGCAENRMQGGRHYPTPASCISLPYSDAGISDRVR